MKGTATRYFASGNTALGRYLLYDSAVQELDTIYMLAGSPGTGKSVVLQRIANHVLEHGWDTELLHCPSEPNTLDGLRIPHLRIGVFDQAACGEVIRNMSNINLHTIDLNEALQDAKIKEHQNKLEQLASAEQAAYDKAYALLAKALQIHDDWERYYYRSMDYDKANQVTEELKQSILHGVAKTKTSVIRHQFLGAATPIGAVDFVPNLTEGLRQRIFIKGRPGSGKSTMLRKLSAAAVEHGIDVDMFHCGLDPNSIDMIILRDLSVAVFDSTPPHEHHPSRDGDELLDMYELTMIPGTDERYAKLLAEIKGRYSATMKEATGWLLEAKQVRDQLKSIYKSATDYSIVNQIADQLLQDIESLETEVIQ